MDVIGDVRKSRSRSSTTNDPKTPWKIMKIRSLLTLVGLAISFALPTFAQEKDTAPLGVAQQRDILGDPKVDDEFGVLATKREEAFTNKDAAAVAALFTEDAVLVAPDGVFAGRQAIQKRYEDTFQEWSSMLLSDPREWQPLPLKAIDNAVWSVGEWWGTLQSQAGPVFVTGYSSAIYVLEGDEWKIRLLTLTEHPRPAPAAEAK
jgi:ketosteroid isomerase-like protein